jgi:predicted  nucleic acid-binding Zn-ribbon protein
VKNDPPKPVETGNLKDRLDGLEFSLQFAQSLAAVSPEREDLQERIESLEAEILEVRSRLSAEAGEAPDSEAS